MIDSGKIKLLLEGDVPPPLTKRGKPKKVKTPGRPTSMKNAMVKEPRENVSNLQQEILILFMAPYSEHDKYEVKLVKEYRICIEWGVCTWRFGTEQTGEI